MFIYRRWNKASNDLQSHVISSRSRKAVASKNTAATIAASPSSSSGSIFGGITDRVSRIFSGTTREDASERRDIVPSTASKSVSKRSYGFATSNVSNFSDQHSENLYRYKNISSDYMRETSPTRDNDPPAITSGTNRSSARRTDNDDRPPVASNTRRAVRRYNDSDHSASASNTGRFVPRQSSHDDQPVGASDTGHFAAKQNKDDDDDDDDVIT